MVDQGASSSARRSPRGRKALGRAAPRRAKRDWQDLPDSRLADVRLCDLAPELARRWPDSWVAECVQTVFAELAARGIAFRPHVWLSDEWFSPDGVPGIAIPFYLAHPRLARLERRRMLEVEGGTREECLRILRHECGHALQHAYVLHRSRRWQAVFGRSSQDYPKSYRFNPQSRNFVQHLRLYYAQSHPDEDFAETFAVWLGPRAAWRRRYAGWPALVKLHCVDELMAELATRRAKVTRRARVDPLSKLTRTLGEHYAERQATAGRAAPQVPDAELRALFTARPPRAARGARKNGAKVGRRGANGAGGEPAAAFLRRHRASIRALVARGTGEYQLTLDRALAGCIESCRRLQLWASGPERRLRMDVAVLLTVHTIQFHYSGRNWVAL
jgi:Putative zinc-binding metallo-peptidase